MNTVTVMAVVKLWRGCCKGWTRLTLTILPTRCAVSQVALFILAMGFFTGLQLSRLGGSFEIKTAVFTVMNPIPENLVDMFPTVSRIHMVAYLTTGVTI